MRKVLVLLLIMSFSLLSVSFLSAEENLKINNDFSNSIAGFGKNILTKEYKKENTVISPLSIHLALDMLYNGAEGKTEKEMRWRRTLSPGQGSWPPRWEASSAWRSFCWKAFLQKGLITVPGRFIFPWPGPCCSGNTGALIKSMNLYSESRSSRLRRHSLLCLCFSW